MTRLKQRLCLMTLVFAAGATSASAQTLGASLSAVKHVYPQAAAVHVGARDALELSNIDYAGLRWSKVDFVFDATGHLSRLTMATAGASYDAVLKLAEVQLNPASPSVEALSRADEGASTDLQIRVCESDDGQVEMTFEPVSVLS